MTAIEQNDDWLAWAKSNVAGRSHEWTARPGQHKSGSSANFVLLGFAGQRPNRLRSHHSLSSAKAQPGSFENETLELYRLDRDPAEQTNLATDQPERAEDMLKKLKAWYADTQRTLAAQPGGW